MDYTFTIAICLTNIGHTAAMATRLQSRPMPAIPLLLLLTPLALGEPAPGPAAAGPDAEAIERGRHELLYGGYVGAGFPADIFEQMMMGSTVEPKVERTGRNASIPHDFTAFMAPEGVEVVGGMNCIGCHASSFRGEFIIGMGNSFSNWAGDGIAPTTQLRMLIATRYGVKSGEYAAAERLMRGMDVIGSGATTPFAGVNPAFKIEELAAAHRRPDDLTWSDKKVFTPTPKPIASDVPPWWHMKKKRSLYYNGMGHGDRARLIQQIGVVGLKDAAHAEEIAKGMPDLLTFIESIEPPAYPVEVDRALAERGREIFVDTCMECHGSYGADWTYPNKVVSVDEVGTDPVYAEALIETPLTRWYNESWFAKGQNLSSVKPTRGYIAPPLDGIWATAPYLHNGSVPTLVALLDSSQRPTFWRRSWDSNDYDLDRVGWNYTEPPGPVDDYTYDTTIPGYSNSGHLYGDDLTAEERAAVIEYLKTL